MWRVLLEGDTNDDLWFVINKEGGKGWWCGQDKFLREENRDVYASTYRKWSTEACPDKAYCYLQWEL